LTNLMTNLTAAKMNDLNILNELNDKDFFNIILKHLKAMGLDKFMREMEY
jgi:hypothetical protein